MQSGTALFRIFGTRRRETHPTQVPIARSDSDVRISDLLYQGPRAPVRGFLLSRTIIHNFFVLLTTVRRGTLP